MSPEGQMIGQLVEGALSSQETGLLLDSMQQDPLLIAQVVDELHIADLISRELNPARSDAAFIEQLNTLIDSGFDPGDNDGGDGGDGSDSGDGPNVDGPTPDPVSAGGAGGGAAGVVKGAAGTVLALAAAGGIYHAVTTAPVEPQPPPAVPELVDLDIIADADTSYSWMYHYKAEGRGNMLNVDGNITKRANYARRGAIVRFDLSDVPDDATHVELRLWGLAFNVNRLPDHMKPLVNPDTILNLYLVAEDNWDERVSGKEMPLGTGEPLTTFSAPADAYTNIDLTDVVLAEKKKDGKLTIRIEVAEHYKKATVSAFASREYRDAQGEAHPPILHATNTPDTASTTP